MPTLTPHFDDFLPGWVARQPWYPGAGTPSLRPVGSLVATAEHSELGPRWINNAETDPVWCACASPSCVGSDQPWARSVKRL